MSGRDHRARTGWTYSRRPRGICQGCQESKVLDRQGLVINHRERVNGRPGLLRCTGSGHTPSSYCEEPPG
jgi:hypothetical protein